MQLLLEVDYDNPPSTLPLIISTSRHVVESHGEGHTLSNHDGTGGLDLGFTRSMTGRRMTTGKAAEGSEPESTAWSLTFDKTTAVVRPRPVATHPTSKTSQAYNGVQRGRLLQPRQKTPFANSTGTYICMVSFLRITDAERILETHI